MIDEFLGLWRICSQVGEEWKCFASQERDLAVIFTQLFIILALISLFIAAALYFLIAIRKSYQFFELTIALFSWLLPMYENICVSSLYFSSHYFLRSLG